MKSVKFSIINMSKSVKIVSSICWHWNVAPIKQRRNKCKTHEQKFNMIDIQESHLALYFSSSLLRQKLKSNDTVCQRFFFCFFGLFLYSFEWKKEFAFQLEFLLHFQNAFIWKYLSQIYGRSTNTEKWCMLCKKKLFSIFFYKNVWMKLL